MLRILLAEDDVNHASLARQTLEGDGHSITAIADGKSALETIGRQPFDLVILDMRLPGIDGREFIDRVRRAEARYADIPIVVVTGFCLKQHLDFFNRNHIRHFLAKPYDCDELATIIRTYDSH